MLCDHLGLPCSLVRGEYSRHWNIVSIKVQEDFTQDNKDSTPSAQDGTNDSIPTEQNGTKYSTSSAQDGAKECTSSAQNGAKECTPNAQNGAKDSTPNGAFVAPVHDHKLFLVDLMFSPGTLLPSHSPQAVQYQHLI